MVTPASSVSVLPSTSNKMIAAVKHLEMANNLLHKYEYLVPKMDLVRLQLGFEKLSTYAAYKQLNPDDAFRFWNAVANMVTAVRVDEIKSLVKRKIEGWNSRYGEAFDKSTVAAVANRWQLDIANSKDRRVSKGLIDQGWHLLKIELDFPWGKCKCGNKILPVWVKVKEFWWVPPICYGCHKAEEMQIRKNAQQVIEFVRRPSVPEIVLDPTPVAVVAKKPKPKKAVKKPVKVAKPKVKKVIEIVASEKVKTEGKKPRGKATGRKTVEDK